MEHHKDKVGLLMSLSEDVTNTPKQESLDDSTLLCSCPSAHWYHVENKMWEKWICSGDAGKLWLQGSHSSEGLDVAHAAFSPQPSLSNCKLC